MGLRIEKGGMMHASGADLDDVLTGADHFVS